MDKPGSLLTIMFIFEPFHEKTNILHMRKTKTQISEADQRLCLSKSEISSP